MGARVMGGRRLPYKGRPHRHTHGRSWRRSQSSVYRHAEIARRGAGGTVWRTERERRCVQGTPCRVCKRKQSETERRERNRVAETGVVSYGERAVRCEVRCVA